MDGFFAELRVRYAETDQMGFAYYSNYLVWFEIARTDYFRHKGMDYNQIEKEKKIFLPVTESFCKYIAPVRYDDLIRIYVKLAEQEAFKLKFEYEIINGTKLCTVGHTKHVFINTSLKPIRIPDDIKIKLA
ncbi:MAG: acyl-CoA thioesterase [Candidatus Omnitrophica bacterium]|nr:acyl-CoA thioesterase [Candidatus Omnitrophota bacterium]